jgi:hypothetical protein
MGGPRARRFVVAAPLLVVLAGCVSAGGGTSLPSPSPSASRPTAFPSAPAAAHTSPSPTTLTATPTPTPTPTGTASAEPRTLGPDTVAVVVTDDLVIRSEPGISKWSVVSKPWLQRRAQLYVLRGPVRASGYEWYEVMPLSAKHDDSGWVAAASRSGEPWIKPAAAPTCPAIPRTVAGLARLPSGIRLACFGGVAISIRAQLTSCSVVMSDAFYDPAMFNDVYDPRKGVPAPVQLSDPKADPCADDNGEGRLDLYLDPAGTSPDPLPMGAVVEVTGIFDHPAARSCTWSSGISPATGPDPNWCRTRFVVTRAE